MSRRPPVNRRDSRRAHAPQRASAPQRRAHGARSSSTTGQRAARRRPDVSKVSTQRRLRTISRDESTPRFSVADHRRRLRVMIIAIVGCLVLLGIRVIDIQTQEGDLYRAAAADQWTRSSTVTADRGTIFDRNGEELAVSIPSSTISINPKLIDDPAATLAVLTSVLGLDADEQQRLSEAMEAKDRGFVYVRRQVDAAVGAQLADLRLSGVNIDDEPRRVLPGGDTGRSVIGLTDIDGVGIAGLELGYDALLTGSSGSLTREVAPGGRSIPGTETVTQEALAGSDLVLTLDRSVQFACEDALITQVSAIGAKAGTCIVMEAATGDLFAMASVRRDADTGEVEITSGNHAAVDVYEPGSVAKVITVAAGLDSGVVGPNTTFVVPWRREYGEDLLEDSHQHPDEEMSVRQILVESSNIGTIDIQTATGRPRHWEYMRLFGLGETTALDFPGESAGILKHWSDLQGSEQVTVSYGQGMASTPVQLVSAVNVIANDGLYVAPRLVRGVVDTAGGISASDPSATHRVVSPLTAEVMRDIMVDVVCAGTATRAQVASFNVAGKTGTGLKAQENGTYEDEFGQRAYYASFVGFFPAEDPQFTVLISIDEPPAGTINRFGGTAAAPVFARLVPTIAHEVGIQPPDTAPACGA